MQLEYDFSTLINEDLDSLAEVTTRCGSWNDQNLVMDHNELTLWSITKFWSFQLPQRVVTLYKLSNSYLLVY
jgi:hypothetical protein